MARAPRIPGLSYIPVEEDDEAESIIGIGFNLRVFKIPGSATYGNNRRITEFSILRTISEGRFSVVYQVQDSRDDQIYALKKLIVPEWDPGNPQPLPQSYFRQINNLKTVKHLNLINLKDVVVGKNIQTNYLLLDYCEYSLKTLIEQIDYFFFRHQHIKNIMLQMLFGLEHLHRYNVIHRDLCPKNILFTDKGILKITDFGSSRVASEGDMTPNPGINWYRAPEILFGSTKYTKASDIWSIGCIFGEMMRRRPLLSGESEVDVITALIDIFGSPNESNFPGFSKLPVPRNFHILQQPYYKLRILFHNQTARTVQYLERFLRYNPSSRASASDLRDAPYFEEHPLACDNETLILPLRLSKRM